MEVTLLNNLGIGGVFSIVESYPDSPNITFLNPLDFGGMGLLVRFCPVCSECRSLSDTDAKCSWLPDLEEVLLSFVSELSVLDCFSSKVFRVFFGIDHRLGLERIGEEMRPRNSLKGVGVSGQSFTQRAGMLSADIDISLKKGGL